MHTEGSRGIAPIILNLGTRWRRMVNFMAQPLERTMVLSEH